MIDKSTTLNAQLGEAVFERQEDTALALLDSGADPNVRYGSLPVLMWAVSHRQFRLVKALLAKGADPNATGSGGSSATTVAQDLGLTDIVALMREPRRSLITPMDKQKEQQSSLPRASQKERETSTSITAPRWLTQLVARNTTRHGSEYAQRLIEGYLEIPDWIYHLRTNSGDRMSENTLDSKAFFDKVFDAGMKRQHADSNYVTVNIGRSARLLMVTGTAIQLALDELGMQTKYSWQPSQD